MDRSGARRVESGRDDHQGVAHGPQTNHASLVLRTMRSGVGHGRPRAVALRIRLRRAAHTLRAQGQARHLSLYGGRAQPPGALRQQAAARQVRWHPPAGGAAEGLPRGLHQSQLQAARAQVQIPPLRQERHRTQRTAALHRRDRRRDRHRQIHGHRRVQSRARAAPHEYRHDAVRAAEHGRVGAVRTRVGDQGPAGLRRLQFREQGTERRR